MARRSTFTLSIELLSDRRILASFYARGNVKVNEVRRYVVDVNPSPYVYIGLTPHRELMLSTVAQFVDNLS